MSKIDNFPYLTPIPVKIGRGGCSLWSTGISMMLGSTESQVVKLINHPWNYFRRIPTRVTTMHRHTVTDRRTRTNGRTTYHGITTLRYASRGKSTTNSRRIYIYTNLKFLNIGLPGGPKTRPLYIFPNI